MTPDPIFHPILHRHYGALGPPDENESAAPLGKAGTARDLSRQAGRPILSLNWPTAQHAPTEACHG